MGTPIVRLLYNFSEGGKMQLYRFFIELPYAVMHIISAFHCKREGRVFNRVVTINR